MNIKISKKMSSLILAGALFTLSSCQGIEGEVTYQTFDTYDIPFSYNYDPNYQYEEIKEDNIDYNSLEYNTVLVDYAYAFNNTEIYSSSSDDRKLLGTFARGRYFKLIDTLDNYYIIDYYGKEGYISKEGIYLLKRRKVTGSMILKGYLPSGAYIYNSYDLKDPYAKLNNLEFVEIYMELDDCYLVETIDYTGYIKKDTVTLLEGDLVVVDRSTQEMCLYEGNELTIKTPVVTGTKDTDRESDVGLFKIHNKAQNLYIIPNYWVDCVAYYNGGEGIHTAEWRNEWEFGGDTYVINGSHGCINTPHDEAMYIYEKMDRDENVLVKE